MEGGGGAKNEPDLKRFGPLWPEPSILSAANTNACTARGGERDLKWETTWGSEEEGVSQKWVAEKATHQKGVWEESVLPKPGTEKQSKGRAEGRKTA